MTQSRGTQRERAVDQILRDLLYLTSSRRHLPGPGDILAVPLAHQGHGSLLVEVKGTLDYPWNDTKGFGQQRRGELLLACDIYDLEPMLCWWPPHLSAPVWLPASDWPMTRYDAEQVSG